MRSISASGACTSGSSATAVAGFVRAADGTSPNNPSGRLGADYPGPKQLATLNEVVGSRLIPLVLPLAIPGLGRAHYFGERGHRRQKLEGRQDRGRSHDFVHFSDERVKVRLEQPTS